MARKAEGLVLSAAELARIDFAALPQAQEFPSMHFYPAEWYMGTGTMAMTPEQRGGFIDLLAQAWTQKPPCSLPDDPTALAGYSRLGAKRWSKVGGFVRSQFVKCSDGRLRNAKQVTVWLNMRGIREKRRGARNGESIVPTTPTVCDDKRTALSTPLKETEATTTTASPGFVVQQPQNGFDIEAGFREAFAAYPLQTDETLAMQGYGATVYCAEDHARCMRSIAGYKVYAVAHQQAWMRAGRFFAEWRAYENLTPNIAGSGVSRIGADEPRRNAWPFTIDDVRDARSAAARPNEFVWTYEFSREEFAAWLDYFRGECEGLLASALPIAEWLAQQSVGVKG